MTVALARRFKVDVSADNTNWIALKGITDLNPNISNSLKDSSDYDNVGYSSQEKVGIDWSLTIKALRKTTAGVFDAGQELVRAAQLNFGDTARVYVRWYDRNGAVEAYSGWAVVGYDPSKTAVDDLDEITITLTGDGILSKITNPYSATAVPVISQVTPSGAAVGNAVAIYGTGFVGTISTTGVKFGGVNATTWTVQSDNLITAVLPAGSAGSAPVIVTNGAGASTAFPYTRA